MVRVKILLLGVLKCAIENAYTSKKDDEDDNDDNDNEHKNVIDTGKELLCPIAIALMMPQIFWTLVSHCRPCLESDMNIKKYFLPVQDMLEQALPHFDWSYLNCNGRQGALSKQEKENLRQEKMIKKNFDEWKLVTPLEDNEA